MDPARVKQLIREALISGTVSFSVHALRELAKDDLTTVDCTNILLRNHDLLSLRR